MSEVLLAGLEDTAPGFEKKIMTISEVAGKLGLTPEAIRKHVRELFPERMVHGKTTYLAETDVAKILEKLAYKPAEKPVVPGTTFKVPHFFTGESYDATQLATYWGCDVGVVLKHAARLFGCGTDKTRRFTEAEVPGILEAVKAEVEGSYVKPVKTVKEHAQIVQASMTVKELADRLMVTPEAIRLHIRELFPERMREREVTLLTEREVTVILERMKAGLPYAHNVGQSTVESHKALVSGAEQSTANQPPKKFGGKMSLREVAETLGVSQDTVYNSARELFPDMFQNGKATYLGESQVTAVKMNLSKNGQVLKQPKTDLEMMLQVQESMLYLSRKIQDLESENKELRRDCGYLANQNSWLIAGHQKLGEEALKKYGGLPYWHD